MKNKWLAMILFMIGVCLFVPRQIYAEQITQGSFLYDLNIETKEAVLHKYTGQETVVNIPSEVKVNETIYKVTEIGDWAFTEKMNITHVTIPEGVKKIGEMAFASDDSRKQSALKTVTFPSTLEYIGQHAFYMTSLEKAELPSGLKEISVSAFQETNLTEFIVPEGVTELNALIVAACDKLEKVVVHAGVNKINPGFVGAGTKIEIHPDNPTYKMSGDSLVSKDGKTLVGVYTKKKSYRTPEGVVRIGRDALDGPSTLEKLTVSEGVEVLEDYAVWLDGLKELILPKSLREIGVKGIAAKHIKSLYLPEGLRTIKDGAFENCEDLRFITIPSTVKEIGSHIIHDSASIQFLSKKAPKVTAEEGAIKLNASSIYVPNGKGKIYKKALKGIANAKKVVEVKQKKLMTDGNLESITVTGVLGENMYGAQFKRKGGKYGKNPVFYQVQPGKSYVLYARKGKNVWKGTATAESLIEKIGKTGITMKFVRCRVKINNGAWKNKMKISGLKSDKKYVVSMQITKQAADRYGYKKGKVFKEVFYTKK